MSTVYSEFPHSIRLPSARRPSRNPLFVADTHTDSSSDSEAPSSCSSLAAHKAKSKLRVRLLLTDQRSPVTGSAATSLQVAYLLKDVKHSKTDPRQAEMKRNVELICTRKGQVRGDIFISMTFRILSLLSHRSSLRWILTIANNEWAERVKADSAAPRNIDTNVFPYCVRELYVLVLSPAFLPDADSISILPAEYRHLSSVTTDYKTRKHYRCNPRNWQLIDEGNCPLLEGPFVTNRSPTEHLSVFALLVNSHQRMQDYAARGVQNKLVEIYRPPTISLMDLIFYVPPGFTGPQPSFSQQPAVSQSHSTPASDCTGSLFTHSESGSTALTIPDRKEDCEGSNSEGDSDDEVDKHDLTSSEMNILMQKAGDGSISGKKRVDAAMMLFGMSGRHKTPKHPLFPM